MTTTLTRVALISVLLLWFLIFPFAILRILVTIPNLYTRWIQDGHVYTKLQQVMTHLILRDIPSELWSPWINRHPDVILDLMDIAVDRHTFQELAAPYLVCWMEWWVGERSQPCFVAKDLIDTITPSQWELMRAHLWESLPLCAHVQTSACKPEQPADYAETGLLQNAWWAAYRWEFVEFIIRAEKQALSTYPDTRTRKQIFNGLTMLVILLTLITLSIENKNRRVTYLSLLFLGIAVSTFIFGVVLARGFVRYSLIWQLAGRETADLVDFLFPQIWPMLAYILGMSLIFMSCLIMVPALVGLAVISQVSAVRLIGIVSIILILGCAYLVLPDTVFTRVEPQPVQIMKATPTPWPTLTPTVSITPSPTPRPWPVLEGTPLPQTTNVWWLEPEVLRCTFAENAHFEVITLHEDELWLFQAEKFYRYQFKSHHIIEEMTIPRLYDHIVISPSGGYVALASHKDIYFYSLPDWEPVLRSRMSTLEPIQSIMFIQDESRVVLGLKNGYIWVSELQTGRLVTLFPAHQSPVTALADSSDSEGFISGAADGSMTLWDAVSYRRLQDLSRHTEAITSIVSGESNADIVSLDVSGRFMTWDALEGTMLRERTVAGYPFSNLVRLVSSMPLSVDGQTIDENVIVAGTTQGQVFLLDNALRYQQLVQFDSKVSFVYPVSVEYLAVGLADGRLCVLGSPQ